MSFFGPFFSQTNAVRLEVPEGELLLGFDGRVLELALGDAPPRLTFINQWDRPKPGWRESPELRFGGGVAKQWCFAPGPGANPLYFVLFHYLEKFTVEVRFAVLGGGLAGSYYVHEGLKPLVLLSLGLPK